MFTSRLIPALACGSAVAVAASMALLVPNTIPMGETNLTAGTTKIGEIDPAALPTSGPDAAGKLCNKVPGGVLITDLTFSIKKGTAASVEVEGVPTGVTFSNATAHVNGLSMGGNVCLGYTLKSLSGDTSGANLICNVTPSYKDQVAGAVHEVNALPLYELSALNDMARNGTAEVYHRGVLLFVANADPDQLLCGLTGSLSFPAGVDATIESVHLREADGDPVTPVQGSHSSTSFEFSGFPGVKPKESCRVLVLFTAPLEGKSLRATITGSFTSP